MWIGITLFKNSISIYESILIKVLTERINIFAMKILEYDEILALGFMIFNRPYFIAFRNDFSLKETF